MSATPAAVLFDLDGTLIDSAPDLAGAANDLRARQSLTPLPYAQLRPLVGSGARGMLQVALSLVPGDFEFETKRDEFLQIYAQRMTRETRVFPQVLALLQALQTQQLPWGIVTNKAERFTKPLVQSLPDLSSASTVVCGDTTPHAKPHPAPLLEAARQMGVSPQSCWYVGDDLRDVQAGRAAGMKTVAVAWGYLGEGEPINEWHADHVIQHPNELLKLLAIV
jgi:N-acetyl-D-muramate 6-phosphate phosphatase